MKYLELIGAIAVRVLVGIICFFIGIFFGISFLFHLAKEFFED
jgi:hypothetical protein